jgi:uncharacterized protein
MSPEMPMNPLFAFTLAALLATGSAVASDDHLAATEAWRAQRLERLQRPDGWLSLVGLHWLEPGAQRVGAAADNDLVLATGPARLGVVTLQDGEVSFAPEPAAGAVIDGQPLQQPFTLTEGAAPRPLRVQFADGDASFQLIQRGDRYALRVRDANAKTRSGFIGIEHYPVDPAWRVEARFEAHPAGKTIDIVNVLGQVEPMPNPGALVFTLGGREQRLEAVDEGEPQLFLIFADRSNRADTYGAGRFLYFDKPTDGRTVLDFNRAYNPPCAFTAHSTCPLPPPENRLNLAVTAGEKRYRGPTE